MKAYIPRLLMGIAVFLVGAMLLLDTLNIVNTSSILADWWPLFIVLGGVVMLISDAKNYIWALIVIVFGVITQLQVQDYTDISPWQIFWPLVLIAIGSSIAFRRPSLSRGKTGEASDDIVAILAGSDQKNTSDNFTGSKVTTVMGGAKIDLRKATIKKSATIEVFTFMGGVELVVPRSVIVKNQTNAILGGVENKTDQEAGKNAPVLTIVGDVIMGGIEIKN